MTIKNRTRSKLLAGVGTTVLASLIAGGAYAAETAISPIGVPSTDAHRSELANPVNNDTVTAVIDGSVDDISVGIDLNEIGAGDPISADVSANTLNATATGNNFVNLIDLEGFDDEDGLPGGAAALGLADNADGALISSRIVNVDVGVTLSEFSAGSATNVDNQIAARTQVNAGRTEISGVIPNQFDSGADGSSTYDFTVGTLNAAGTVVATSVQRNFGGGHDADVEGNTIGLIIDTEGDNEVDASPALDRNSISASLAINSASNLASLESGGAPSFDGSAVVTNLQANAGGTEQLSEATNIGSSIEAAVTGQGAAAINRLNGGLSVQDNAISSAATGNDASGSTAAAGNRIVLGDGVSFDGAGSSDPVGSTLSYTGGGVTGTVVGDLVIQNSQGNQGAAEDSRAELRATTTDGEIFANVESLENGTIAQEGNAVTASVTGNTASSAIASGENAAGFDGTVAVASQQTNDNTDLTATNTDAVVGTLVGTVFGDVGENEGGVTHGSTVSVATNKVTATGYGNNVSQSVALAANDLTTGTGNVSLSGGTDAQGNASAFGAVTVTNLQSGYGSDLSVTNSGSMVGIDADSRAGLVPPGNTIFGAGLTVDDNDQEAVALGNAAGNSLLLAGNTVGSSAGIASVQILDANSSVSANLAVAVTGVFAGTHVDSSAIDVTDNVQRAIAYGGSADNDLVVDANASTVTAGTGTATVGLDVGATRPFGSDAPDVAAAYGVLNQQVTEANVSASAEAAGSPSAAIGAVVEGNLTNSSVTNEGNGFVAAAYGNDAMSGIGMDAGTIAVEDGDGYSAVAAVTNAQSVDSAVSATATGDNVILTLIEDNVDGSSVSTSGNAIQALATGNRAGDAVTIGNDLSVVGTTIDTAFTGDPVDFTPGVSATFALGTIDLDANASFVVQNAQSGAGSVSASLVDDPDTPTSAASVTTVIGAIRTGTPTNGSILGSSVASDGNLISAAATSNSASNRLSLEGNSVATTTGAQNFQVTSADVSASIGAPGTPPTDGDDAIPINFVVAEGTGFDAVLSGVDTYTVSGLVQIVDASIALDDAQFAYLDANGWDYDELNDVLTRDVVALLGANSVSGAALGQIEAGTYPGTDEIPEVLASDGTPGRGGVTIIAGTAAASDVTNSSISVSGNETSGSVTGNTAVTRLDVSGTTIATGSELAESTAESTDALTNAEADHAIANYQDVGGDGDDPSLTATVHGSFGVDTFDDAAISASNLTVSDNTQRADANANVATNLLSLEGTTVASGSALVSEQWSTVDVGAASTLDMFAPAAVDGSTIALSGNDNLAVAAINTASNLVDVGGSTVSTLDGAAATAGTVGNALLTGSADEATWTATADHVLTNRQQVGADSSVDATAVTVLLNEEAAMDETTGLAQSSLSVIGNRTIGQAYANDAANTLNLDGSADQGASGGIVNRQVSAAETTANATTTARVVLNGTETPEAAALSGSSLTMDSNVTAANARGNTAVNTLTSTAGAGYGTSTAATAGSSFSSAAGLSTQATAAVLNAQENTGDVEARSVNTSYTVALNAGAESGPGVSNGSISVSGNTVSTSAYGNRAENSVTMSALAGSTPTSAIGSSQVNSGAILASVTGTQIGTVGTGSVGGSSLSVGSNSISASAVGNSVSNVTRVK